MLLPGYNFFIYMFGEDPAISEKLASGASILLHTNASPAFVKVTVFKATYLLCSQDIQQGAQGHLGCAERRRVLDQR